MTKRAKATGTTDRGKPYSPAYLGAAANVEAIRLGHPEVDPHHLLLALLVTGGPGGRLLLDAGVTLDRGRRAIHDVQRRQLGDLGIDVPMPAPLPATYGDSTLSLPLSGRAKELMFDRLSFLADEQALLVALIEDEGGQVRRLFAELGVDGDALLRSANHREPAQPATDAGRPDGGSDPAGGLTPRPGWLYASHSQDLPVPADRVWELISDPERRAEWGVDCDEAQVEADGVVRLTRKDERAVTQTVIHCVPGREIAWQQTPADGEADRTLHLVVAERGDHSTIRLELGWPHNARGRISRRVTIWVATNRLRIQAQSIAQTAGR